MDAGDHERFLESMEEFNARDPIGSLYEHSFQKHRLGSRTPKSEKLVDIVCYCLNPNHYHLILEQVSDYGIIKFMQRLGTGYTNYFNKKHERTGALFQGKYKAIHVDSNEYLLHLSAYINLNDKVHQLGSSTPKSSWEEYIEFREKNFCKKEIILDQFNSRDEYKKFAESSLVDMIERKKIEKLLLE
ncbi:hypothetical protein A3C91_04325 [Candidatus Azambacteria bacterium RIFCSPHIGHO2_02_FULL_52_12]|uniref:Transposase IS200-like domain-containing protein n=1 Tax=Candidatus Azambacteria bacterium RIFCSPLOWO2_01_FULL_46_25 TaxID=1797298 RepID=A0A1F5BUB2_9BACT|nr:MAG: hypothetical protein A3C91_04325 [Candidatus Azambacteria bacterium RIFCSPHIGHO2_02_FULL_52_12]OGD34203.1 MAG: hypothetical protein A2988_01875 [Candidatus Azambacteria bacterium RIFCSPLOWO2_01_FULL_46_25]OGD36879.1 MAG: hypothetical protein A2850_00955 [Candidatus Azambacteria bacterium RIFCSPHIGHO2_01_FULL_51_74]